MKLHEGFPAKPESKQVYKTEALGRLNKVIERTEELYDPRVAPNAAADLETVEGREARASYLCRQILNNASELTKKANVVARDPDQPRKRVSKVNQEVDGSIGGYDLLELENSLREVELLQDTRTSISSFATALPRRVTNFMIDFTTRLALGFN